MALQAAVFLSTIAEQVPGWGIALLLSVAILVEMSGPLLRTTELPLSRSNFESGLVQSCPAQKFVNRLSYAALWQS